MDYWFYLFKNISQLKEIPDKFIGTPFQKVIEMLGQEKADWIRELEEDEVLKEIRKREVDEASKISYNEGVEYGQELGIKKGHEERRKLLQKIIAKLRAKGLSDQEIMSMLDIDSLEI